MAQKRSTWSYFTDVATERQSLTLGVAGVVLSLVQIFAVPDWTISGSWMVVAILVALSILWLLIEALKRAIQDTGIYLPDVRTVVFQGSDHPIVLLLDRSILFGLGSMVSVFHEDEEYFERLVATGSVQNVQGNGYIQVLIESWEQGHSSIRTGIEGRSPDTLSKLRVRPSSQKPIHKFVQYDGGRVSLARPSTEKAA